MAIPGHQLLFYRFEQALRCDGPLDKVYRKRGEITLFRVIAANHQDREVGHAQVKLGDETGESNAGMLVTGHDQPQILRKLRLFYQAKCLRSITDPPDI